MKNAPLANRLVLHRFMCGQFGYADLAAMLDRLRDVPAGFAGGGESHYARALYINPERGAITPARFAEYDAAIAGLSARLRMTGEQGRGWKPHQYLALLFSEHYLRRWFEDPERLRDDLNRAREQDPQTRQMPAYTMADLRTVAVQSATGSGKTLIMHAHILQYRRLAADRGERLNNIVLVTPNEQLSAQHERELRDSNLPVRLFSSEAGPDLLAPIEIIDLNKLAERKGVKRVAVSDFGERNLVLVDEGHLGATGKVWRERRAELARGGFTFEYSATFNQIAGNDDGLGNAYGKCLLFDYPYRAFHADGYGKDYAITNLPGGAEDENSNIYLLACLLSFYRQCRIWRAHHAGWTEFNVTRPLWVFLGKTVTGTSQSQADRATRSDVIRILDFLGFVLARPDAVRTMLDQLVTGQSGLTDEDGSDWFAGRFDDLSAIGADSLYDDICQTLFHGKGQLHVVYLTQGEGELHLRAGDSLPFGVVNIGDSAALHRILTEAGNPDLAVEREAGFVRRLFADVDREDSTVNIVIGARRFIAGWNSWRVSTMGLMHVGVSEGPEIIQMFGRGVRLKGWKMSLKRHRASGAPEPAGGAQLAELETLRIFGLRANYMRVFRDLLQKEGIATEAVTIPLPTVWNFARKGLKMIRLREGVDYARSDQRLELSPPDGCKTPVVELDLYSRLQGVESGSGTDAESAAGKIPVRLERRHIALFDRARLHDRLLARKQRMVWHNLSIPRATVDSLLECHDWYRLYLPPARRDPDSFRDLRRLEEIALDLMTDYADRYWRRERRRWEHRHMKVVALDENDGNNVDAYQFSVDAGQTRLIQAIRDLRSHLRDGPYPHLGLGAIMTDRHAYRPLLYSHGKDRKVTVQPALLNDAERQVVETLAALARDADPCLDGHDLFLIRNRTGGRGVSFFDDYAYFPDFILWLVKGEHQHMVFLDPKGLVHYGREVREKVELHNRIKDVEARAHQEDPNLWLHAFILSVTPPDQIGDEKRSKAEWEEKGVCFLEDSDWPQRVFCKILPPA